MCGIAGAFSLSGRLDPAIAAAVPGMTAALRHRGPDGDGYFNDGVASLGHRRLAIIDVAGGDQPIANETRDVWVVFNGEIYNHRTLREFLTGRGHRFRTNSDTEVIVHAYEEFGTECVARLDGMFAFALYDARRRELLLARDRLGKKPCFYGTFGGALHFGSEIKALRCSPAFDGMLAEDWVESYLALGYIVAPKTVYRHVRKLEPGCWLRASRGGIQVQQYWDVTEFDTDRRSDSAILEDVDSHLRDAVSRRMESEVPLGAFLSGGIDSGLVVSYMAEIARVRPTTVSVGFEDGGHNELDAAGQTARWLGTRHYQHVLAPSLPDVVTLVAGAFDEPFADPSAVPTYEVSRAARQHVTVALSGDGGDETFAGYDFRYVPHAMEGIARRLVPTAANPFVRALANAWPRSPRLPKQLRLASLLDNLSLDPADAYFCDLTFLKPRDVAVVCGRPALGDPRGSASYAAVTDPYRRCPSSDAVQRAEYADLKVYMPNGPLVKVDRMSMLNGLEVRCPLLDTRLVELAFRVPAHRKLRRLHGKHPLRQLAARRLPPAIAGLPKRGFSAPAGAWTNAEGAFEEEVLSHASPLASSVDLDACRRLYAAHVRGERERPHLFWALWMASRWLEIAQARTTEFAAHKATTS